MNAQSAQPSSADGTLFLAFVFNNGLGTLIGTLITTDHDTLHNSTFSGEGTYMLQEQVDIPHLCPGIELKLDSVTRQTERKTVAQGIKQLEQWQDILRQDAPASEVSVQTLTTDVFGVLAEWLCHGTGGEWLPWESTDMQEEGELTVDALTGAAFCIVQGLLLIACAHCVSLCDCLQVACCVWRMLCVAILIFQGPC